MLVAFLWCCLHLEDAAAALRNCCCRARKMMLRLLRMQTAAADALEDAASGPNPTLLNPDVHHAAGPNLPPLDPVV